MKQTNIDKITQSYIPKEKKEVKMYWRWRKFDSFPITNIALKAMKIIEIRLKQELENNN